MRPAHIVGRKGGLSADAVREIRKADALKKALTRKSLAHRFGVSLSLVGDIQRGRAYKWVR